MLWRTARGKRTMQRPFPFSRRASDAAGWVI
jgi:hypothetical protein